MTLLQGTLMDGQSALPGHMAQSVQLLQIPCYEKGFLGGLLGWWPCCLQSHWFCVPWMRFRAASSDTWSQMHLFSFHFLASNVHISHLDGNYRDMYILYFVVNLMVLLFQILSSLVIADCYVADVDVCHAATIFGKSDSLELFTSSSCTPLM